MTITCFGEYLLRFSPPKGRRIVQANAFEAVYGGAEANVAAALAGFGWTARYVTALPENPLGDGAIRCLRALGLDTSGVRRCGERIGTYYLEKGADLRPSRVVYDRRRSAAAEIQPGDFDWDDLLDGSDAFFFTGITPAIGPGLPETVAQALAACRKRGVRTACDLNYRPALWDVETAGRVMRPLVTNLDLLVANEEHADLLLNVRSSAEEENARLRDVASAICRIYGIRKVALTLRRSMTADVNAVSAVLYDSETDTFTRARELVIQRIVDRIGGGDAFTGGLLYALHKGLSDQEAVDFAAAANAFKHSIEGDALIASADEISRLAYSDGTVRMVR